jgi:hypothetical protein
MAGKEGFIDRGLETWQSVNKITLTAEAVAITGGLLFGVPWLIALGGAGAVIDGVQYVGIKEVQKRRAAKATPMVAGREYKLAMAA